jgi:glycosyltransferase involved in cell wall biosynthesis
MQSRLPLLAVLVASLRERHRICERMLAELTRQTQDLLNVVRVLAFVDDGNLNIGWKRNTLLYLAEAEYVCFVDDDDEVSEDYIRTLVNALQPRPDCVGISGVVRRKTPPDMPFRHSVCYKTWTQTPRLLQCPIDHVCPVRTELALRAGFPHLDRGEDKEYAYRLGPMLTTEIVVERPIYRYYPSAAWKRK